MKKILSRWGFSKRGLIMNSKGEWYFFAQMLVISLHLLPPFPKNIYISSPINILFLIIGVLISIKGLIISIKAFLELGDNLTPLPHPIKESILIKNGLYKNARHPLYKGLLLISLGISILSLSLLHLCLFISLAFVIKNKALKEEERLKLKFPEYKKYIKEVPAIIENIKFLDWRS